MTQRGPHRPLKQPKRAYSRFGSFFAISLVVFCFIVVPIKLLADSSPAAAVAYGAFSAILLISVVIAFMIPVTEREHAVYSVRRPMELDPTKFDSTKDGVSW